MNTHRQDEYRLSLEQNENRFISVFFESNETIEIVAKNNLIVFLTKGTMRIHIEKGDPVIINAPSMFLIPKGRYYERVALSSSDVFVLPVNNHLDISFVPSGELVSGDNSLLADLPATKDVFVLTIETILLKFLNLLKDSISAGFDTPDFFNIKIRELMFLMEKTYSREDRLVFFSPVLNAEYAFSDFIYNNYKKVKTVKELADLSFYSLSGFEKKFRRIFGVSPSKWLKEKLSMAILHEITKTTKPFKEISQDYGFSSPSHFNNFCKDVLGMPPGELRKKNTSLPKPEKP